MQQTSSQRYQRLWRLLSGAAHHNNGLHKRHGATARKYTEIPDHIHGLVSCYVVVSQGSCPPTFKNDPDEWENALG